MNLSGLSVLLSSSALCLDLVTTGEEDNEERIIRYLVRGKKGSKGAAELGKIRSNDN